MIRALVIAALTASAPGCYNGPNDGTPDPTLYGCAYAGGTYTVVTTIGAGCGDLDRNASQCIEQEVFQSEPACHISFDSTDVVNGGIDPIARDASFADRLVGLGSVMQATCTGTFAPGDHPTYTLACVAEVSGAHCDVTLTRTSTLCH